MINYQTNRTKSGIKLAIVLRKNLVVNLWIVKMSENWNGKSKILFHNGEIPKEDSDCTCLSLILNDSVLEKDGNYYLKGLLGEFKCLI